MRRPLALVLALALTAAALSVAACSDDEPEPTPTAPAPTETAAAATPAATVTSEDPATATPPAATATAAPDPGAEPAAQAALQALGQWLGPVGNPDAMTVESVEPMTWPDGCLGLGRPGQVCTDALVEGFRVEVALASATYEVRTNSDASVVLWAPGTQVLATFQEAGPNVLAFMSDDGNTITAQAVPGTEFGVDPNTLAPGAPVALGLADAPQSGGLLLVWLDAGPE